MEQQLVTVVIPIYNVEAYLDRCIRSVVDQTYRHLEIILVDDGSTDGCPALCDEWAARDNRIRVIHKENAGLGMARNTGIANASGTYIFFFDSDDYVATDMVEKCVLSAEENTADVVIYGVYDVYEDGTTVQRSMRVPQTLFCGAEVTDALLPQMFTYDMGVGISAWGKMYRLSVFRESGVLFRSEREIISEDAFFALEFYPHVERVSVVEENLYYYSKRSTSLSRAYKAGRQKQNDFFMQKAEECILGQHLTKKLLLHVTVRYHMYTVAAIKQMLAAAITKEERKQELRAVFGSEILRRTLTGEVIRLHKRSLQLFFLLLKYRCHALCLWLVRAKNRK